MASELRARWAVLETEARASLPGLDVVPSGVTAAGADVLVGIDGHRRRYVLVPVNTGEVLTEDHRGRAVHLVVVRHGGRAHLAAVCLRQDLNDVFLRFGEDLLEAVGRSSHPARTVTATLNAWRQLLAEADREAALSEEAIIGLRAEIQALTEVLHRDPLRRLGIWTGPHGHQHDLRWATGAVEVKATLLREGRIVGISSIDQLAEPPGGTLHLAHYRYERSPDGESLDEDVSRLRALALNSAQLERALSLAGYSDDHREIYQERRHRLVERRLYDALSIDFPRITPASFVDGSAPPGTLRISYSIDLTNTPPHALPEVDAGQVWEAAAAT